MPIEVPIEAPRLFPPMARLVVRVMPEWLRIRRPFSSLGLSANARLLRQHFDSTDSKCDSQAHWEAIEGATAILERFDIPHLEKSEHPTVWRSFLARIVAAADDMDIKKAREVMSDEESFRWEADKEIVGQNQGDGWLVARLIMRTPTVEAVEKVHNDFKRIPDRTSEIYPYAARALKINRLLNKDDQDEDWWWDFYEEANTLNIDFDQVMAIFDKLEKEFPDE